MKRFKLLSLFIAVFISILSTSANETGQSYKYFQNIEGLFVKGERGRINLSNEVYNKCLNFPEDIIVSGADGSRWPSHIYQSLAFQEYPSLVPTVADSMFINTGEVAYLEFDLILPKNGTAPFIHNGLEIETSGSQFQRKIMVYAGAFKEKSECIGQGYLVRFENQATRENRYVYYSDSELKKIHFRIYADKENVKETFELKSVRIFRIPSLLKTKTVVHADTKSVPENEESDLAQTYMFDLKQKGRAVEEVHIHTDEVEDYVRSVDVYGRDQESDDWQLVGNGEVHVVHGSEVSSIQIISRYRYLKIHVYYGEEMPLGIRYIELKAIPDYLVFEAESDGSAKVFFGSVESAESTNHLTDLEWPAVEAMKLFTTSGTEENLQISAKSSWWNYSRFLTLMVVLTGAMVVGGVILKKRRA